MVDMSLDIAGIRLKNPVIAASGTFGYGLEFEKYIDLNLIGGISVKGLSVKPRQGNPTPRIVETPSGMLNAIGLQNIGIDAFIKDKMPLLRKYDTAIIANFFGDSVDEYVEAAERLSDVEGIAALEMNISCPNKQEGWLVFGTDPSLLKRVVGAVRKVAKLPLIVKLSPNVTDITVTARAAEESGADVISLINTLTGMAVDIESRKPKLANITGGLSGPAIKPVALKMVWQSAQAVSIPVIGLGGIMRWEDAVEFLLAGASAVQVGTANFVDPEASLKIVEGIEAYCRRKGVGSIREIIGSLKIPAKG
ncbi:MAG: dihydroorotate dehydrogenase [Nitrospinota bacterium]|nr:dihydroorotate dehydrogenase [Nitrospinota bacterium]